VLWTWRGQRLSGPELATLACLRDRLSADLGERLAWLLTAAELDALSGRVDALLDTRRFPLPSDDWPPIPWPPF
jgi:hypothetical protein